LLGDVVQKIFLTVPVLTLLLAGCVLLQDMGSSAAARPTASVQHVATATVDTAKMPAPGEWHETLVFHTFGWTATKYQAMELLYPPSKHTYIYP
jgi:hypothetical protein